jgi:hypothetical protein
MIKTDSISAFINSKLNDRLGTNRLYNWPINKDSKYLGNNVKRSPPTLDKIHLFDAKIIYLLQNKISLK